MKHYSRMYSYQFQRWRSSGSAAPTARYIIKGTSRGGILPASGPTGPDQLKGYALRKNKVVPANLRVLGLVWVESRAAVGFYRYICIKCIHFGLTLSLKPTIYLPVRRRCIDFPIANGKSCTFDMNGITPCPMLRLQLWKYICYSP